jgi:hypothetical protein
VYCANSDLLVLYVHEEKSPPDFSPNPTLELLFAKMRAQIVPKTLPHSPIKRHTTKTKLLRIRPTMATLVLAQHNNQPTISRHKSKYEDNS